MAPNLKTVSLEWDDDNRPVLHIEYADTDGASGDVEPEEWLGALAERLGEKSTRLLRKLMELNETDQAVSLARLATEAGVEKKEADGWNRNLGRSIKAVVRDYGFVRPEHEDGTAQLFDFHWDNANNQWLYSVPAKFRTVLADALSDDK